jgi:TM2 domain-containing membrane protein YozV
MEQSKVDMFMTTMNQNFPPEKLMLIRDQLLKLDDSKFSVLQTVQYKNPTTLLIVSILIGGLGVDRFMLGETGLGIAKLLTCGGLGIWTIIDWFTVMGRTRELNYQNFAMVAI